MMRRTVVFAIVAGLIASATLAAPTLADHRGGHGRNRDHRGWRGERHGRHDGGRHGWRPRVYTRAPRAYYYAEPEVYYAPPPVIYAPLPPPGIGFNLIFPFHIR